jgi:uncharacterized membrane protein YphA (DoxX/SURF4 family)
VPVSGEDAAFLANLGVLDVPLTPAAPSSAPPVAPLPTVKPKADAGFGGGMWTLAQATPPGGAPSATPAPVTAGPRLKTAEDFSEPVPCRAMWMIALSIHKAAHPVGPAKPMWPVAIGEGLWPKVWAMAVYISEIGGGFLVLVGMFTRIGACGIAGVVLGAIWLTQIGPAWQMGTGLGGILPAKDWLDVKSCQTLLWQVSLLAMAAALMLMGSGAMAIDRAMSGYRGARSSGGSTAR